MNTIAPEKTAIVVRLKDDLEASLRFVLGDDYASREADIQVIIDGIVDYHDGQPALLAVKTLLGTAVYGQVLLFHLENRTELKDDAEALTFTSSLARVGMTVADLGWPDEVLHPAYVR